MDKPLILLVDDIPTNLHVLAQALRADYDLKIATNGELALELARLPDQPDLILLDVMMPGIDGYEVCRRLKADPATRRIPVIFVTARDNPTDEEYGLNLGASDYIVKPFILAIVRARVRNHIVLKLNADLLESLAAIDSLTRLANRRRFDEALLIEWNRALRSRASLAIIFADIDHFKNYNDHYGHGAGDRCLVQVADALSAAITRPGDTAARYGGEEFIAVLPDTDATGAQVVAERFRATVEALVLPHAPTTSTPCVTVSVGYISVVPSEDYSPADLIEVADRALYQAKHDGRNCVRMGT